MNILQSTRKFLKTPSDAKRLATVGAVFFGSVACFWSLVPKPYRAETPQELSQYVRESTRERLKWSPAPFTDPETDAEKIEAQWKVLESKIADENATTIAAHARQVCSSRAWPVDAFWGKVNGKGVWIILTTGDERLAMVPQAHLACINGLSGDDGSLSRPVVDPTEIVIIDSEAPFNMLYHDGRKSLV